MPVVVCGSIVLSVAAIGVLLVFDIAPWAWARAVGGYSAYLPLIILYCATITSAFGAMVRIAAGCSRTVRCGK
jgi:hypothetical protein